jgi:glycyl-tRNA synthetase beta chain
MSELLFEIGTEELPAGYIGPALTFLAEAAARKLNELGLAHGEVRTCGTPRRLTLVVDSLQDRQEDRRLEHLGPAKKAGFDQEGKPTKAALGFARSRGVEVEQLKVVETAKGAYLMAVEDVKGQEARQLLPPLLESLLREVPFPKSMRWANTSLAFARPIQWLLALYGGAPVAVEVESITSGTTTRGHRFLAPERFEVRDVASYFSGLTAHRVVVDLEARRNMVIAEVKRAVQEKAGDQGQAVLDEGLLDTVTNLVEHPFAICGSFDEKFLQLPEEVLVTSMREHQKYFPVRDQTGRLLPLFVAINNTDIQDRQLAASGHERVLRARLEDGLFFFNEDRKTSLAQRRQHLDGIIFQQKLGTMQAKTERMVRLAGQLADQVAAESKVTAVRVAELAKADLLTEMVGEFPSLQGVMGREYARHDGETEAVALAIQEHYLPLRAGGTLPDSDAGALVGIADRIDTLAGCFAIGERPTGNKDAFGLRRQAIGLIHIIRHRGYALSLSRLIEAALAAYDDSITVQESAASDLKQFIRLRFENDLVASGLPQEVVEAATSVSCDDLVDCFARINALRGLHGENEFKILAGSFKRIRNIIKDNQERSVDESLLVEPAEQELFATMNMVRSTIADALEQGQYAKALTEMLVMKEPVDQFFDAVMVMADDAGLRRNRLNLLTALGQLVLQVGDISRMHVDRD